MDAIFWKHYNLYTLLSCDHHLLFIDVKVLVHELQGLCAADEGQRVQAEDGPVLIHSSHVLGIFSLDPQGCHAADTQEEGELTTGSGHDQESLTSSRACRLPPRLLPSALQRAGGLLLRGAVPRLVFSSLLWLGNSASACRRLR